MVILTRDGTSEEVTDLKGAPDFINGGMATETGDLRVETVTQIHTLVQRNHSPRGAHSKA